MVYSTWLLTTSLGCILIIYYRVSPYHKFLGILTYASLSDVMFFVGYIFAVPLLWLHTLLLKMSYAEEAVRRMFSIFFSILFIIISLVFMGRKK